MVKLVLTLVVATLTPMSAFAWKAMSTSFDPIQRVYISDEQGDENSAKEQALARCRALAINKASCKAFARPFSAEIAVVMLGEVGLSVGYGKNPAKALAAAQAECGRLSKSCDPFDASASKQVRYAALAVSPSIGYFSHVDAQSQEEANNMVLALCEKRKPGQCKLDNFNMMHAMGSYAEAITTDGTKFYIQRAAYTEIAQSEAIRKCEIQYNKPCVASPNFRPVFNSWTDPFNKEQWDDITAINEAGNRNRKAQLNKFVRENR